MPPIAHLHHNPVRPSHQIRRSVCKINKTLTAHYLGFPKSNARAIEDNPGFCGRNRHACADCRSHAGCATSDHRMRGRSLKTLSNPGCLAWRGASAGAWPTWTVFPKQKRHLGHRADANAHKNLDKAVAEAYGWTDYADAMPDKEILRRLLALNLG